ncbi:hypothetical protein [uncultured Subdoligranulum sp.]|uniref:hypothetical protein n=1 Tax=uncultured Subdoligranulum sp. TaxID=512298 RepID=UPI0025CC068A|nr:hypothetical protein [uncultured Subdoligranulum sp.]
MTIQEVQQLAFDLKQNINGWGTMNSQRKRAAAAIENLVEMICDLRVDNAELLRTIIEIQRMDNPMKNTVTYTMTYSSVLGHSQVWDIAWMVFFGLMQEDQERRKEMAEEQKRRTRKQFENENRAD